MLLRRPSILLRRPHMLLRASVTPLFDPINEFEKHILYNMHGFYFGTSLTALTAEACTSSMISSVALKKIKLHFQALNNCKFDPMGQRGGGECNHTLVYYCTREFCAFNICTILLLYGLFVFVLRRIWDLRRS